MDVQILENHVLAPLNQDAPAGHFRDAGVLGHLVGIASQNPIAEDEADSIP